MANPTDKDLIFQEEPIDFKKYLNMVYRKRWVLFSVVSVIMVITFVRTFTEVPKYRATAVLLADIPASNMSPTITREGIRPTIGSNEYFATQQNLIRSGMMAKRVKESLKTDMPASELIKMLYVEQAKNSRVINLSITYSDPVMAAKIANTYADSYIEENVENMLFMSKEVLKALPGEDRKKIENSTVYGQLKEINKDDAIDSLPSIYSDPVVQRLKSEKLNIETELANLSKRYKEKHPKIIALQMKLAFADENLKTQKSKVLAMVKADLAGRLQINNIRIIDPATVPQRPVSPNRPKDIVSGLILSVFVGISIIFFMESLDDSVKNKNDIEETVGLPYLGEFPVLTGKVLAAIKGGNGFQEVETNTEAAEAIRNIRTNIIFSAPKQKLKTILLTSTIPQEGKSFLASYLAYSFAKNGIKTLLVDGDVRKPTINKYFGIMRSPGLTNLLVEDIPDEKAIYPTAYENLYVIPSGSKTPNPLELLDSDALGDKIKELSGKFGKIIIDAPPSLALSDALILSKVSEGVILVTKSGYISKDVLKRVNGRFHTADSRILGVVMNFFRMKEHEHHRDKYYYKYYKKYYHSRSKKDRKDEHALKTEGSGIA